MMIRAEVHSDDFQHALKFDATPFFEAASAKSIQELAGCDWGGDYPADKVAQFVSDLSGYEDVAELLGYCQEQHRRGKSVGFECHVHESDAMAWLQANKPEVFEQLQASTEEEEDIAVLETAGLDRDDEPYWDKDSSWTGDYLTGGPAPQGSCPGV